MTTGGVAVLRRFEMYKMRKDVSEEEIAHLRRILQGCGDYIPEVIDSVAARDLSDTDIDLIWENAYESPESYQRYMCHPFHISILDRYLLPENPECILAEPPIPGLGLLGYEIETPDYRRRRGIRRVVALRVSADATAAEVHDLESELRSATEKSPDLELSLIEPNLMGEEWAPGVWSHVWEQAFDSIEALERFRAEERWSLKTPVESWVAVHYRLDDTEEDRG